LPKHALGVGDLREHRVLIVGTGREGQAMAEKLATVSDLEWIGALEGSACQAQAWQAQWGERVPVWVLSEDNPDVPPEIQSATIAIMSPGVAATGWLYGLVRSLGIPMTSGSALFTADNHAHIVGVTGSKGKSTTATLVHHVLSGHGENVALGGNMGIPVVGLAPADRYVIEYSSYQCHYLEASPVVSVISALFPEHLDWHGSVDAYYADKLRLIRYSQIVVANGDDQTVRRELGARYEALPVVWVGSGEQWHLEQDADESWLMHGETRLIHSAEIGLIGRHNHQNALLALAAATLASGADPHALAARSEGFSALPNRLEKISDPSGVIFVNDSLATNPQASAAALRALPAQDLALLIGGMDRGVDYAPLVEAVLECQPRYVFGLPENGPRLLGLIAKALEREGLLDKVQLEEMASMEHAVIRARDVVPPGGYVVLSPAAPSFGTYRDYQDRADDFRHWITTSAKDAS